MSVLCKCSWPSFSLTGPNILFQAYQIYVMGWPRPQANGLLGLWYPWLIKSEVLHYAYALVMLIGIWVLRKGFTGTGRRWWTVALVIQFWHHIEHLLLITQATMHHNFWGKPVPVSVLQLFIPARGAPPFLQHNCVSFRWSSACTTTCFRARERKACPSALASGIKRKRAQKPARRSSSFRFFCGASFGRGAESEAFKRPEIVGHAIFQSGTLVR